jgi:phosphoglycolate phosphatase-like HAD superfamily hydrolase
VRPRLADAAATATLTDIQVSRATGIRSIGFAKTPIRGHELRAAGADAITDSVATLADLIRRSDRT